MLGTAMMMMAGGAYAACSSPVGNDGEIRYASNYGVFAFCNGTDWVSMAGWNNSGGGGASLLNELTDVDTTGASSGKILSYNGSQWVVSDTISTLAGLADVNTSGATSGKILAYDGSKWVVSDSAVASGGYADHIISGTTSLYANSTNTISVTTNGTVTGYWDTAGRFITPGISVTNAYGVSSTNGYFSGNVGIGTSSPNAKLEIAGAVSSTGIIVTGDISYTGVITDISDRRKKHDIQRLADSLEAMLKLQPVSFRMNDRPDRVEYGFIAQDIEKIYPILVDTGSDPSATKSLNYIGLMAPIVRSVQQLKADNDNLRAELNDLRRQMQRLQRATDQ